MTAEEIFEEIKKSPVFKEVLQIPQEELDRMSYGESSSYKEIEIIKTIIRGGINHTDKGAIFRIIQNQIMQL